MPLKRKRSSSFADKAIKSLEESEGASALKRDTSGASLRRNPSEASANDGLEDDDEAAQALECDLSRVAMEEEQRRLREWEGEEGQRSRSATIKTCGLRAPARVALAPRTGADTSRSPRPATRDATCADARPAQPTGDGEEGDEHAERRLGLLVAGALVLDKLLHALCHELAQPRILADQREEQLGRLRGLSAELLDAKLQVRVKHQQEPEEPQEAVVQALRGLANRASPRDSRSALISANVLSGIKASPRISTHSGGLSSCRRRGMALMVRTLAVISSPRWPSPRVAARSRTPSR